VNANPKKERENPSRLAAALIRTRVAPEKQGEKRCDERWCEGVGSTVEGTVRTLPRQLITREPPIVQRPVPNALRSGSEQPLGQMDHVEFAPGRRGECMKRVCWEGEALVQRCLHGAPEGPQVSAILRVHPSTHTAARIHNHWTSSSVTGEWVVFRVLMMLRGTPASAMHRP
jgi:hypothetical protein